MKFRPVSARFCFRNYSLLPAFAACLASVFISSVAPAEENWPCWRGRDGNGVSLETDLPLHWNEDEGVVWKCKLPEWGNGTPVILDGMIYLTSHDEENNFIVLKIEKQSGEIVWTRKVGSAETPRKSERNRLDTKFHSLHNMASPAVAVDRSVVITHFGDGEIVALDHDGEILWHRNLQEDYGPFTIWWGHANSPVLHDEMAIFVSMQDPCIGLMEKLSDSYVVAYDKMTGRERWRKIRNTGSDGEYGDSYVTPIFREIDGRTELIVWGGETIDAYDPTTGERFWWLPGLTGNRIITGIVAVDDMLYATRGMRKQLFAVRTGGSGEQSLDDVVWEYERGTCDASTPAVYRGLLFMVTDRGISKCLDAATGKEYWQRRIAGNYYASPLAADGRIYFQSQDGLVTVVRADKKGDVLAENRLDDTFLTSPIVSEGRIYLRGRKRLYAIGSK